MATGPDAPGGANRRLGRYEVLEELGRGGMGVVYRGRDPLIGRTVAIKTVLFSAEGAEAQALRMRLLRESQAAGLLAHPNIVSVFDVGEQDGVAYIVMEFIDGRTLEKALAGDPSVRSAPELLRIVSACAQGLDYAHSKGVVHRDVKPANVMLESGGGVKIADFGIAKMLDGNTRTQTTAVVGSPYYIAPEQLKASPVSGQTDQYALATLAYMMLTGRPPFEADTMASLVTQTLFQEPPPVQDQRVNEVLRRALAKDPAARFPTCVEFAAALASAVQGGALPLAAAPRAVKPPHRALAYAMGTALAVLLAGAGTFAYLRERAKPAVETHPASTETKAVVAPVTAPAPHPAPEPPKQTAASPPNQTASPAPVAAVSHPKEGVTHESVTRVAPPAVATPAKQAAPPCRADLDEIPADKFEPCLDYWTGKGYSPAAFTAYRVAGGPPLLTGSFQPGTDRKISALLNPEQRAARVLEMAPQHYRPDSITILVTEHGPLSTIIWASYPEPFDPVNGLLRERLQKKILEHENDGYRLVDLAGFRFSGPARFSAVWSKRPSGETAWGYDLKESELADRVRDRSRQGFRISRLSAYDTVGGRTYAVVWEKGRGGWLWFYNQDREQLLQRQAQAEERGLRLHHISWLDGRFCAVWWQ